jgi:uncharacterized repeat protein (TIGR01451 family)
MSHQQHVGLGRKENLQFAGEYGMKKVSRGWIWLDVLVLAVLLLPAGRASAQTGWSYWRQITIQSSQVAGDLTGFPVILSLSGDWLKDAGHGGHVALADGGDILFLGTDYAKLDHEIEEYNGTDGTLVAWVRIPSLSAAVNTEIYMLYGNPDAPGQSNPAGVWDANYLLVQHLQETSGTHADSTTNGNDCAPMNGVVQDAVGILDGADDFDGDDDYLDCGIGQARGNGLLDAGVDSLNPVDAITLEAWAQLDVLTTGNDDRLVSRDVSYGLNFAQLNPQDRPRFKLFDTSGVEHNANIRSALNTGEWYYLVGTWVSPTMEFYLNGVMTATAVFTGSINSTANPTLIGAQAPDGRIDEVRISDIARSGEWIQTSYNNQSDPSAFFVLGPEQQPGVAIAKVQDGPPVAPGSEVTFTIAVTNTGDLDLTGMSVIDAAAPDCHRSLGSLIAGGYITYSCSVANVTAEFTNTATVSGSVSARTYVSDTASAFVDLLPSIAVTKTADPEFLIEPGGTVTFSVAVDNTSAEPLTLTSLIDSIHGDVNGQGSCLVPQNLAPGVVYGCAFTATVAGSAGYQEVDEITASVGDDEGNVIGGSDSAAVTLYAPWDMIVAPTVLTVTEPASTEVFSISLTTEPAATVTVPLSVTNQQCTVTVKSAVLDPDTWAQGVTVTVAAVDDPLADGTQLCEVRTGAAQSADPAYAGLDGPDVTVFVLDDDTAAVLVAPTDLEVGEPDGSALFTITLQTEPSGSVSIALSTSNDECTAETISGSEAVLDSTNWNLGVGVTVMALDDGEDDGEQVCVVQTDPAESVDDGYDGIDPADVTVIVHDDDALLRIHLPRVLRGWPPVPTLDPLPGLDCDGLYTVSWSAVQGASAYRLQEAADCTFADAVQIYEGAETFHTVTGQAVGSYCYRVRALGPGWTSAWSNSQAVDVLRVPDAPLLEPIDNADGDGSYPVRWDGVDGARTYVLTEARGDACGEPVTVYTGPATSYGAQGRGAGRLCYYVRASNECGQSAWSDSRWVDVLWEAEPNDDMHAGANGPLVPGLNYHGALPEGDPQDYFYIDLPGSRTMELWLTDIPAGHDYDLYLRNAQGTVLAGSSRYGNADEHILTGILPQGRYYIQVHHYSPGGSTQPYRLRFEYP